MFLECTGGDLTQTSEGVPSCSGTWTQSSGLDMTPIVQLNDTLVSLFTFDTDLLNLVLGGAMLLFSIGWGAGKVLRLLGTRR